MSGMCFYLYDNKDLKTEALKSALSLLIREAVIRRRIREKKFSCNLSVSIEATPESKVKSFWLLINPESNDPPKVAIPLKYRDYFF